MWWARRRPEHCPLSASPPRRGLRAQCSVVSLLVLSHLQDPSNVGTISLMNVHRMKAAMDEEEHDLREGGADPTPAAPSQSAPAADVHELVKELHAQVFNDWMMSKLDSSRAQESIEGPQGINRRRRAELDDRRRRADIEDEFFRVAQWKLSLKPSSVCAGELGCFIDGEPSTSPKNTNTKEVREGDVCLAKISREYTPSVVYDKREGVDTGKDVIELAVAKRLRLRRDYRYFTYVTALPTVSNTPMEWSEEKLEDLLLGTTLYDAVVARKHTLRRRFEQMRDDIDNSTWERLTSLTRIQQSENFAIGFIVQSSMDALGKLSEYVWAVRQLRNQLMSVFDYRCTYEDYLWAAGAYRSRMMHVPAHSADKLGTTGDVSGDDCVVIAPGIDFVNHQRGEKANAYWRVEIAADEMEAKVSPPPTATVPGKAGGDCVNVSLFLKGGRRGLDDLAASRGEVTIDYGAKSNEELLFLHGFCEDSVNEDDTLMLHVPLPPPNQWGEGMQRRLKLVQMLQAPLQFFIRFRDVSSEEESRNCFLCRLRFWRKKNLPEWCSEGIMSALRVMTLSDGELSYIEAEAARILEEMHLNHDESNADGADLDAAFTAELRRLLWNAPSGSGDSAVAHAEAKGRVLMLLRELLQIKLDAMVAGTGTIEDDALVLNVGRGLGGAGDRNSHKYKNEIKTELHAATYRKVQKEIASKALEQLNSS